MSFFRASHYFDRGSFLVQATTMCVFLSWLFTYCDWTSMERHFWTTLNAYVFTLWISPLPVMIVPCGPKHSMKCVCIGTGSPSQCSPDYRVYVFYVSRFLGKNKYLFVLLIISYSVTPMVMISFPRNILPTQHQTSLYFCSDVRGFIWGRLF